MPATSPGETPEERHLIDNIYTNLETTRVALTCIEERMKRGEFVEVLEHIAAVGLCWMAVGDEVFENLLTHDEQERIVNGPMRSDLEAMTREYLKDLRG